MAALALLFAAPATAHSHKQHPKQRCSAVKRVWSPARWRRGAPKQRTIDAFRSCPRWAAAKRRFYRHRRARLRRDDINHRWTPHWAPDWSGPTLAPWLIAALAEKAGDVIGVDVPGWTMEEVTIGESGRRPGSAGVDVGGTRGYGLWAITSPFADAILARHGWSYEDMWNPVRCAIVMAEIYKLQGLGAWYGTGHVTSTDAHYRGRARLSLMLGGRSFRAALAG